MLYAIVNNQQIIKQGTAEELWPGTNFYPVPSKPYLAEKQATQVKNYIEHDSSKEKLEQTEPYILGSEVYAVKAVLLSEEELEAVKQQQALALQQSIVNSTQERLNAFASTRNYDGILSACTYATSPNQKFAKEGKYCVEARDNTWTKLYEILAEVQEGVREAPSSYYDIEPELPVLTWPA